MRKPKEQCLRNARGLDCLPATTSDSAYTFSSYLHFAPGGKHKRARYCCWSRSLKLMAAPQLEPLALALIPA